MQPAVIKKGFKLVYLLIVCFVVSSCGSTQKSIVSQPQKNIHNQIYAKLEKQNDSYSFTQFSLFQPTKLNEPWVDLSKAQPLWDYKRETSCAKDRLGVGSDDCLEQPELFMEFDEALAGALTGLVMSAGILTSGYTRFDEDAFSDAYKQALSKIEYQGLVGNAALQSLPDFKQEEVAFEPRRDHE